MAQHVVEVTGGVDTHNDTHTAAAVDSTGRVLGSARFPTTTVGYRQLLAWLRSMGTVVSVGIEGTGSYGIGLARHFAEEGVAMVEIDRPDRKTRRHQGKSDPIDALAAARAALAGYRTSTPKQRDRHVEALRQLRVVHRGAVDQRSDVQRQIKSLIVTAPDELRDQLRGLPNTKLIKTCAALRPDTTRAGQPLQAAKIALRALARRHQTLTAEITDHEATITPLVAQINPTLLDLVGVGPDCAGQLLVTAGQNPERLRSEASFAALCGVSPIPVSSGRTDRYRLNRGGDRQANAALHRITVVRMRWDPRTRTYTERRTTEGKTKKEIIRCLKRLIAREIYYTIRPTQPTKTPHNPNPTTAP